MASRTKVTYGKSSRPPSSFSWAADGAPSPEKPHKLPASAKGSLKRPAWGSSDALGSARKRALKIETRDPFEVPSDDEIGTPPTPATAKKIPVKPAAPKDEFEVPSSDDEPARPPVSVKKLSQSSQKLPRGQPQPPKVRLDRRAGRAKTPGTSGPATTKTVTREKVQPQHTARTSGQLQGATRSKTPSKGTTAANGTSTAHVPDSKSHKPASAADVFGVPSSDDDHALRASQRPAKSLAVARTGVSRLAMDKSASGRSVEVRIPKSPGQSQPTARATRPRAPLKARQDVTSLPKSVDQKVEFKETLAEEGSDLTRTREGPAKFSLSKAPERSRPRATPKSLKSSMSKGTSSPARLHGMLALRSVPQSPPHINARIMPATEDETMYDIQEKTPVAPPKATKATKATSMQGSVTPRQKYAFGSLLDDATELRTPDMPSIKRLRLTDSVPMRSTLGLTRSSSDVPATTHSRKMRLVDTLRRDASSSEDDSADSESESEGRKQSPPSQASRQAISSRNKSPVDDDGASNSMEIDERAVQSQASQNSIIPNNGARRTYAQERSYRQEENPEDDLLVTMDLDDTLGLPNADNRHEFISESGDEPDSQVRSIHELRRKGQNQKFLMNTQHDVDEIADTAGLGPSMRRNAMLDFCTKMFDHNFLTALLESPLSHDFLISIKSKGDIVFDFSAAVAVALILKNEFSSLVLEDIRSSGILDTLQTLLERDTEMNRIAKERKTNLSPVARGSVADFCTLVHKSEIWVLQKPDLISPQIVALATLELLVLGLRTAGNRDTLIAESTLSKLVDLCSKSCDRLSTGKGRLQDDLTLRHTLSLLESLSISTERQGFWSQAMLQRFASILPAVLTMKDSDSTKMLAIRLCVQLSNNKPRVCAVFAGPDLVQALTQYIVNCFEQMEAQGHEELGEVSECLILALGAMINLAELSDQARANVAAEGCRLVDALTQTFLTGIERAAQAESLEQSTANVPIGYLTVLLGNMCLNTAVRKRVRSRLPGQQMDFLITEIRKFVRLHQRVDKEANRLDEEDGNEIWQDYTTRLMHVAERLERTDS